MSRDKLNAIENVYALTLVVKVKDINIRKSKIVLDKKILLQSSKKRNIYFGSCPVKLIFSYQNFEIFFHSISMIKSPF